MVSSNSSRDADKGINIESSEKMGGVEIESGVWASSNKLGTRMPKGVLVESTLCLPHVF